MPEREFRLLRALPMFAPLPWRGSRAGAALVPVRVRAGEAIIREGEVGDRFYVVGRG